MSVLNLGMRVAVMTMIIMPVIVMAMMTLTDRRTDDTVSQINSQHFPEVPPSPADRLSATNPLGQAGSDPKHDQRGDQLQDHELRQVQRAEMRQRPFASEELRYLEVLVVADVMEGIPRHRGKLQGRHKTETNYATGRDGRLDAFASGDFTMSSVSTSNVTE